MPNFYILDYVCVRLCTEIRNKHCRFLWEWQKYKTRLVLLFLITPMQEIIQAAKNIFIISWEHVNNIDALLHGFIRYPYLSQGGILQIPRPGRRSKNPKIMNAIPRVMLWLGKGDLNHVRGVGIFWNNILQKYPENFRQEWTLKGLLKKSSFDFWLAMKLPGRPLNIVQNYPEIFSINWNLLIIAKDFWTSSWCLWTCLIT